MASLEHIKAGLALKCPRCHKGRMFLYSATNLSKFDKMPECCPVCGLYYEIELGFYWGAMYMSYGLSVAIVLVVGLILYYGVGDPPTWVYLSVVASTVILLTPLLFRYARMLMLYLFGNVSYDPKYHQ